MSRLYDSTFSVRRPDFISALYRCESTLEKQLEDSFVNSNPSVFNFNPSVHHPSPPLSDGGLIHHPSFPEIEPSEQDYFFSTPVPLPLKQDEQEKDLPLSETFDVNLFEISSYGVIRLGIEMLKTAAKDIRDGENAAKNTRKAREYLHAKAWLEGYEDCALPLFSCLALMEHGLREQGLEESLIPDMQANSHVLLEWIMGDPDEAYRYLTNYQDLFSNHHRRRKITQENYDQLKQDTSAYHINDLEPEHQDKKTFCAFSDDPDDDDEENDSSFYGQSCVY